METKSQKFRRLAEARTDRAISALQSLAKLSNKNHYEYSDREVQKIIKAIKAELDATKLAFELRSKSVSSGKFSLD